MGCTLPALAVRATVMLALERRHSIGWDEDHLVRLYLDLMMTLGCDFGAQPSEIESPQIQACQLYGDYEAYRAVRRNRGARSALRRDDRANARRHPDRRDRGRLPLCRSDTPVLTLGKRSPESCA